MNSNDQKITASLRTRISGVNMDDASVLSRIVNGVAEDLKLSEVKVSVLQVAVAEGVLPLIRGLAGQPDVKEQLNSIAVALMAKRHLDRRAARYSVRLWAAALDVLPSPAATGEPGPSGGWAILRRIHWSVIVVAAIAFIGLGVYFHREIGQLIGNVLIGLLGLAILYVVKEVLCAVFSWPARKLVEGLKQIKYGLDWIPGSVYILAILTLGIADWLGVFPYGMRDVAAFVRKAELSGNTQPATEDNKVAPKPARKNARPLPTSPASDAVELPSPKPVGVRATPAEAPANVRPIQQTASGPGESISKVTRANMHGRPLTATASEAANAEMEPAVLLSVSAFGGHATFALAADTETHSTHILEFHLPEHGNDALHTTIQGDINVGSVTSRGSAVGKFGSRSCDRCVA